MRIVEAYPDLKAQRVIVRVSETLDFTNTTTENGWPKFLAILAWILGKPVGAW